MSSGLPKSLRTASLKKKKKKRHQLPSTLLQIFVPLVMYNADEESQCFSLRL